MILHAPQLIVIVFTLLGLGIELERNGKPKEGNYNFGVSLVASIISTGLLWWGGFFG